MLQDQGKYEGGEDESTSTSRKGEGAGIRGTLTSVSNLALVPRKQGSTGPKRDPGDREGEKDMATKKMRTLGVLAAQQSREGEERGLCKTVREVRMPDRGCRGGPTPKWHRTSGDFTHKVWKSDCGCSDNEYKFGASKL